MKKRSDTLQIFSCLIFIGLLSCRCSPDPLRELKASAKQGDTEAQFALSIAYENGEGVPPDSLEAYKWKLAAAEQGHVQAQFQLGKLSEKEMSIERAERWFRKAAEQGNKEAQKRLNVIYAMGESEWQWMGYLRAEEGDPIAQNLLGSDYEYGTGILKDHSEAFRWKQLSANQGHPNAQYGVGKYYEKGIGVPKDIEEAIRWYRRAAEQGFDLAQLRLGIAYAMGEGMPRDLVEAYKWVNLSAAQSNKTDAETEKILNELPATMEISNTNKKASEWRSSLEKAMSSDQIAEAQKLSREWLIRRSSVSQEEPDESSR